MEWKNIGEILEFQKKSKIKAGEGLDSGKYLFYTSSSTVSKYFNSYEFEEEALIFGTGGSASVHHSYGKFSTSTDCFVLKNNNKYKIILKYIYLFLKGNIHLLENGFKGAGLKHISKTYLEKIKIPVPDLQTQKKIVEILDKSQSLIDKRKEQIKLYDDLIQATFYNMFGDPVKNEKGWEVKKLEETSNIITGNTPSRKEVNNYGNHIEWIKSDNINTPSTFLTRAEEYLSEDGLKKGRFTDKNSILMTCIAGSLSCIGNVAVVDRKVAFNQQINAIVPLKYETMFLYVLFLLTKKYIQNSANNSMKGMISKGKLQELEFIVPDKDLQNKFAEKVEAIEKEKIKLEEALKELENNYNALVQKVFK
ncbi:MAG: restriction endonuclease subunit S [Fusobacterium sp.]|nr:restriction endonuclease subunit S [Fusobacterium sp.]